MNTKKYTIGVFAVAIAAMVMVAGVFVITNSDDSEATTLTPTVNVYYYNNGWVCSPQTAYDLYQAVYQASGSAYTITTSHGSWVSGYNPDKDYGMISEINNSSSFHLFAYDNASQQWKDVTASSIGWIRPFADYGAIVNVPNADISASANVAIVTGTENVNDITGMIALGDVHGHTNTLYKFTLHDNVGSLTFANAPVKTMVNGVWTTVFISASNIQGNNSFDVYGYGSDAYLALIDAVGANLVSDNMANNKIDAWVAHIAADNSTYYTYYSWMVSLFGVGTTSDFGDNYSTYWYWMSSAPNNPYLSFNFGYYSQLTGAYNNVGGNFNYTYYTETYYW